MGAKQFYNFTLLIKQLIEELHAIREALEIKDERREHHESKCSG